MSHIKSRSHTPTQRIHTLDPTSLTAGVSARNATMRSPTITRKYQQVQSRFMNHPLLNALPGRTKNQGQTDKEGLKPFRTSNPSRSGTPTVTRIMSASTTPSRTSHRSSSRRTGMTALPRVALLASNPAHKDIGNPNDRSATASGSPQLGANNANELHRASTSRSWTPRSGISAPNMTMSRSRRALDSSLNHGGSNLPTQPGLTKRNSASSPSPQCTSSRANTPSASLAKGSHNTSCGIDARTLIAMSCIRTEVMLRRFDANKIEEIARERKRCESLLQEIHRRVVLESAAALKEQQRILKEKIQASLFLTTPSVIDRSSGSGSGSGSGGIVGMYELQLLTRGTEMLSSMLELILSRPGGATIVGMSLPPLFDMETLTHQLSTTMEQYLATVHPLHSKTSEQSDEATSTPVIANLEDIITMMHDIHDLVRQLRCVLHNTVESVETVEVIKGQNALARESIRSIGNMYTHGALQNPVLPFHVQSGGNIQGSNEGGLDRDKLFVSMNDWLTLNP